VRSDIALFVFCADALQPVVSIAKWSLGDKISPFYYEVVGNWLIT